MSINASTRKVYHIYQDGWVEVSHSAFIDHVYALGINKMINIGPSTHRDEDIYRPSYTDEMWKQIQAAQPKDPS